MTSVVSNVSDVINEYLNHLQLVKPNSENTILAYKRDLNKFFDYTNALDISDIYFVSSSQVSDYKDYLLKTGLSSSSSSRALSALRSLFTWIVASGKMDYNPAKDVHNDKAVKRDTNILTQKEIETLLNQPDKDDPKGIRDKAMLELLYATGIKVSELIALNVEDLNFQISFLRVGESGKERYIPLYKLAIKTVQSYIFNSRKLLVSNTEENALFVNCNGERMTRQGVWKILKYYAEKAGIKTDINPHTLRHSFAAHLLQNGADIHDIQEILGHSDIASTQRYTQFLKDKIKTSYIKFHPRA